MRYAFIKAHESEHTVRRLCSVMAVHPSGYYAWRNGCYIQRRDGSWIRVSQRYCY